MRLMGSTFQPPNRHLPAPITRRDFMENPNTAGGYNPSTGSSTDNTVNKAAAGAHSAVDRAIGAADDMARRAKTAIDKVAGYAHSAVDKAAGAAAPAAGRRPEHGGGFEGEHGKQ